MAETIVHDFYTQKRDAMISEKTVTNVLTVLY